MPFSRQLEACLIAVLAAGACFSALSAFGEQSYSVVAQSNTASAATGRRPLAERIVAANQPALERSKPTAQAVGGSMNAEKAKLPTGGEISEVAIARPSRTQSQPPARVTLPDEMLQPIAGPQSVASAWPTGAVRDALLERVKSALAGFSSSSETPTDSENLIESETDQITETLLEDEPDVAYGEDVADGEDVIGDLAVAEAQEVAELPMREPASLLKRIDHHLVQPLAEVPAWLEFDVRESRSLLKEGEQVVMRIAVRNVGGLPAEGVTATIFFSEGVEPVQATGCAAEVSLGEVRFQSLDSLLPGASVNLLVTAVGTQAGKVVYRGELQCSQLPGNLAREGAITVSPRQRQ